MRLGILNAPQKKKISFHQHKLHPLVEDTDLAIGGLR